MKIILLICLTIFIVSITGRPNNNSNESIDDEPTLILDIDHITTKNGLHYGDRLTPAQQHQNELDKEKLQLNKNQTEESPIIAETNIDSKKSIHKRDIILNNESLIEGLFKNNERSVRGTNEYNKIPLRSFIDSIQDSILDSAHSIADEQNDYIGGANHYKKRQAPSSISDGTETIESIENVKDLNMLSLIAFQKQNPNINPNHHPIEEINLKTNADDHNDSDNIKESIVNKTNVETENKNIKITSDPIIGTATNIGLLSGFQLNDANATKVIPATPIEIVYNESTTEFVPIDANNNIHVQQQQLTVFNTNAGLFSAIPSINIELKPNVTNDEKQTKNENENQSTEKAPTENSSVKESSVEAGETDDDGDDDEDAGKPTELPLCVTDESDVEDDNNSGESDDTADTNGSSNESNEKSSESKEIKCRKVLNKNEQLKNKKDDILKAEKEQEKTIKDLQKATAELKVKIAEVEADPLIVSVRI